jgi:hypothetical protein
VTSFFGTYSIGILLHNCGVRKRHGYGPRLLLETIFSLPFYGMNLYRGIVVNDDKTVVKDAVYELLGTTYNWRRLLPPSKPDSFSQLSHTPLSLTLPKL